MKILSRIVDGAIALLIVLHLMDLFHFGGVSLTRVHDHEWNDIFMIVLLSMRFL